MKNPFDKFPSRRQEYENTEKNKVDTEKVIELIEDEIFSEKQLPTAPSLHKQTKHASEKACLEKKVRKAEKRLNGITKKDRADAYRLHRKHANLLGKETQTGDSTKRIVFERDMLEMKSGKHEISEGTLLDKKGKPLILFRGSDSPFDEKESYNKDHLGHSTGAPSAGEAFFFSNQRKTADYYSKGANPNKESSVRGGGDPHIDKVNLIIKNPLVYDFKGKFFRGNETSYYNLLKKAKEEGFDGVIFKNTYDGGEYGRLDAIMKGKFTPETIYGVFEPEQIVFLGQEKAFPPKRKEKIIKKSLKQTNLIK